jgi:hypothetical protein
VEPTTAAPTTVAPTTQQPTVAPTTAAPTTKAPKPTKTLTPPPLDQEVEPTEVPPSDFAGEGVAETNGAP